MPNGTQQKKLVSRLLVKKQDPADITTTQFAYMHEFHARVNALQKSVLKKVKELVSKIPVEQSPENDNDLLQNKYDWPTSVSAQNKFRKWLEAETSLKLVGKRRIPSSAEQDVRSWADTFVESSYRQGIVRSYLETKGEEGRGSAESSFAVPKAATILKTVYDRNFSRLKGITEDTADKMRGILARGLADGKTFPTLSKEMTSAFNMTRARAATIARTETSYAHAEGTLIGYEVQGIEEVGAMVEFSTVQDEYVCPDCAALEQAGNRYKVTEAHGIIPVHPNCRCVWLPWVPDEIMEKDAQDDEALAKELEKKKEDLQKLQRDYIHKSTSYIHGNLPDEDRKRLHDELHALQKQMRDTHKEITRLQDILGETRLGLSSSATERIPAFVPKIVPPAPVTVTPPPVPEGDVIKHDINELIRIESGWSEEEIKEHLRKIELENVQFNKVKGLNDYSKKETDIKADTFVYGKNGERDLSDISPKAKAMGVPSAEKMRTHLVTVLHDKIDSGTLTAESKKIAEELLGVQKTISLNTKHSKILMKKIQKLENKGHSATVDELREKRLLTEQLGDLQVKREQQMKVMSFRWENKVGDPIINELKKDFETSIATQKKGTFELFNGGKEFRSPDKKNQSGVSFKFLHVKALSESERFLHNIFGDNSKFAKVAKGKIKAEFTSTYTGSKYTPLHKTRGTFTGVSGHEISISGAHAGQPEVILHELFHAVQYTGSDFYANHGTTLGKQHSLDLREATFGLKREDYTGKLSGSFTHMEGSHFINNVESLKVPVQRLFPGRFGSENFTLNLRPSVGIYTSRVYPDYQNVTANELESTGAENLYANPYGLAMADPELFNHMMNLVTELKMPALEKYTPGPY